MNSKGSVIKGIIILFVILGIGVLALGFVFPGLLWARDLGIKYTKEDYNSMINKLNYVKDLVPEGNLADYNYVYGDVTHVEVSFTSEELTAFFNYNRPSNYAIKNVQIKVNENGIEATASVNVDYFLNELLSKEYTKEELIKEYPAIGVIPANVNLYINASGSVTNNKSDLSISSATVQGISIPSKYMSDDTISALTKGIDNVISKYNTKSKSNFEKLAIESGKVVFEGSVPSSLTRVKK